MVAESFSTLSPAVTRKLSRLPGSAEVPPNFYLLLILKSTRGDISLRKDCQIKRSQDLLF